MVVFRTPDSEAQALDDIRELLYILIVNREYRAETVDLEGWQLLKNFKERRVEK